MTWFSYLFTQSDAQKRIQELQISHADTINELEKTRNMLVLQHKINKDYQTEVQTLVLQPNSGVTPIYFAKFNGYNSRVYEWPCVRLVKVERVTNKMVEDKKEFDLRLQEYAQLLDIRAERIKVIDC